MSNRTFDFKATISLERLTRLWERDLIDISFVFFFCAPLIKTIFARVCTLLEITNFSGLVASIVVYFPLLLAFLRAPKKALCLDFLCLWSGIVLFFAITALLHPEYIERYSDPTYGVVNYVLLPTEGIYAYLFLRLVNDPARIIKNMKVAGWIMYVYFLYQIYAAVQRGYWVGVTTFSARAEMTYSVSFGYEVMLFMTVFLYEALLHRKPADIAGAAIGLLMMLTNGSRGPMLFTAIFLFLMSLMYFGRSRKKLLILFTAVVALLLIFIFYDVLMMWIMSLLSSMNISSRFITMFLNGTLTSDSGRSVLWDAALEMIRERPLGYGAMGAQHQICKLIPAGYPHSVVLEILIDFGVLFGSLLLMVLFFNAIALLFKKENQYWSGVFLVFFCTACQLFISLTYWSTPAFWACIAIGMNCHVWKKHKRVEQRRRRLLSKKEKNL